jgi:hypothetical protein
MYRGPHSDTPGSFVRVAARWENTLPRGKGALHAWDVRWHRGIPSIGAGPLLIVTRHTGVMRRCSSRISYFHAESGELLHEALASHKQLRQANMIALE